MSRRRQPSTGGRARETPSSDRRAGGAWSLGLGDAALIVALVVAALRVTVNFAAASPDEMMGLAASAGGFGRVGLAVTDALAVGALGLALVERVRRGAGVYRWLVGLWLIGAIGAGVSGVVRGDASVALSWVGATALGLTAMHLAGRLAARRVMLAALVAVGLALAFEAVYQVAYQHPANVAFYEEHADRIAAERRWQPGDAAQRKFEHRIYENTATGAFGLANVFASVLVGSGLIAAGVAGGLLIAARRQGRRWAGPAALLIGCAAAIIASVALTQSRGALAALLIAGLVIGGSAAVAKRWRGARWLPGAAAVGLVVLAIGAIGARGWVGPPDTAAGERSLLFRWFYVEAAGRMIADAPWLGVGPGGFQAAYLQLKNPLSPEDVAAPHNVFAAWGASIGVAGWAWAAMLVGMTAMAGRAAVARRIDEPIAEAEPAPQRDGPDADAQRHHATGIAAIVGVAVFGAGFIARMAEFAGVALAITAIMAVGWFAAWRAVRAGRRGVGATLAVVIAIAGLVLLPPVGLWAVGAAAFIALTAWLGGHPAPGDGDTDPSCWPDPDPDPDPDPAPGLSLGLGLGLAAAAAAVVLHAQIDMGLTNVMAGPMLLFIIGLAAGAGRKPPPRRRTIDRLAVALTAVALAGAVTLGVIGAGDPYQPPVKQARDDLAAAVANWRQTDAPADRRRALDAIERWLALQPYDTEAHVHAADLAGQLDRPEQAVKWLERALALDEMAYLDPDSQLTDARRAELGARLQALRRLDRSPTESVD